MGLRHQFQDKAKRLAEQAEARARGAGDEATERSPRGESDTKAPADRARDVSDDTVDA
ncbi:hypothetical protein [Streptomyces sp. NPDC091268]|uniref:hypothetical protein n=1 Tax=Streptomyces sp. NPDC091268 TaxID=3365979 RepID=UPI003808F741